MNLPSLTEAVARALVANMHAQVGSVRLARVPGEVFSTIEAAEREIDMCKMAQAAIQTTIAGLIKAEPTQAMWAAGGDAVVGYKNRHHDKVVEDVWAAMLSALAVDLGLELGE